jgi:hypothetical protein
MLQLAHYTSNILQCFQPDQFDQFTVQNLHGRRSPSFTAVNKVIKVPHASQEEKETYGAHHSTAASYQNRKQELPP